MAHQISAILNFSLAENGPSDFGFSLARLSWGRGLMLALVPDPTARHIGHRLVLDGATK